eukprot:1159806-Pelagomonas_calceolata.AAC.11
MVCPSPSTPFLGKGYIAVPVYEGSSIEVKKRKRRKTTEAVKTLPTSIKEKRIPRAEALCIPFTKRNKRKKSMGIRRITSNSLCLILVTRVEMGSVNGPTRTQEDWVDINLCTLELFAQFAASLL